MSTDPMEFLLAQLFADPSEVERFLQDREGYARSCGLADGQLQAIENIDAASLRFTAKSFERKRKSGSAAE